MVLTSCHDETCWRIPQLFGFDKRNGICWQKSGTRTHAAEVVAPAPRTARFDENSPCWCSVAHTGHNHGHSRALWNAASRRDPSVVNGRLSLSLHLGLCSSQTGERRRHISQSRVVWAACWVAGDRLWRDSYSCSKRHVRRASWLWGVAFSIGAMLPTVRNNIHPEPRYISKQRPSSSMQEGATSGLPDPTAKWVYIYASPSS